jgi:hypothetical protein
VSQPLPNLALSSITAVVMSVALLNSTPINDAQQQLTTGGVGPETCSIASIVNDFVPAYYLARWQTGWHNLGKFS